MKRRLVSFDREDGFTMFTAVMVSAIVFVLAVLAFQISQHNLAASGTDRMRTEAINAAESGVDYWYSELATTTQTSLPCSPITQNLTSTPATTFTVDVTFYDSSTNPLNCSTQVATGTSTPGYVLIHSVGKPVGLTYPTRTMQAYVKLTPNGSGAFPATAVFGLNSLSVNSNVQFFGDGSNNADFYTNGNINWGSNSTVYGNVYGQGTVTLSGGANVKGAMDVKGSVSMSGNSVVNGSVTATASTSTISVTNAAHIYGDAKAGSTITAGAGAISGNKYPNTPTADPPTKTYPSAPALTNFTGNGYTAATGSPFTGASACTSANTALTNWTTGNLVIQLNSLGATPCTLTPPSKTLPGNLAILTDGPMTFTTRAYWTAGAGNPYNVYLFVGLTATSGYCDFNTQSNSGMGPGLNVLVYVPSTCTASLKSNSSFASGQVFGGTVNFNSNTSLKYKQVSIPGTSAPGFLEDVIYKREIIQ
jgi:Tfp pilus assembly protein PilX/cytoskeletal protein CcmA (bactofilin family)